MSHVWKSRHIGSLRPLSLKIVCVDSTSSNSNWISSLKNHLCFAVMLLMNAVLPESTWSHIAPSSPVLQLFLPRLRFDSKNKKWSKKWPGGSFLTGQHWKKKRFLCSSVPSSAPGILSASSSSRAEQQGQVEGQLGERSGAEGGITRSGLVVWWRGGYSMRCWGSAKVKDRQSKRVYLNISQLEGGGAGKWWSQVQGGNRNKHRVLFLFTSNNLAVWGDGLYISHCTHWLATHKSLLWQAADAHSN